MLMSRRRQQQDRQRRLKLEIENAVEKALLEKAEKSAHKPIKAAAGENKNGTHSTGKS